MNKRNYILFLIWFIGIAVNCSYAQVFQSDCTVTDEGMDYFGGDADKLALREIYAKGTSDTSSILIPPPESEPFLKALATIYNALEMPARRDIVDLYGIHAEGEPYMRGFSVYVDTSHQWAQQWLNFELYTGHEFMDQLIEEYQLSFLQKPYVLAEAIEGNHYLVVSMISAFNLNLPAFFTQICNVGGVVSAVHNVRPSEDYSKDIVYTEFDTHKEFLFKYGWGDCENSTCNYFHYWKFKVFEDCTIEFSGDYGDLLSTHELQHVLKFDFYPNPVDDILNLEFVGPPQKDLDIAMYDATGHRVYSESLNTQNGNVRKGLPTHDLEPGFYFIAIHNGEQVFTRKIVKR